MKSTSAMGFIICVGLIALVLSGCLATGRTREFVIHDKLLKKVRVGDWFVHAPELRAFRNLRNVGEQPGFDTMSFEPLIKFRKPKRSLNISERVVVDSIIITFRKTRERFVRYPSTDALQIYLASPSDTSRFTTMYFDELNRIRIPMGIDTVSFEFEVKITDSRNRLLMSKLLYYSMVRQEKKRIGITYGD